MDDTMFCESMSGPSPISMAQMVWSVKKTDNQVHYYPGKTRNHDNKAALLYATDVLFVLHYRCSVCSTLQMFCALQNHSQLFADHTSIYSIPFKMILHCTYVMHLLYKCTGPSKLLLGVQYSISPY